MPDITYLNLVAGTIPAASDVANRVFFPSSPTVSLGVVNGNLDTDNFKGGDDIEGWQIQRRAFSGARSVGLTAPSDYPVRLFARPDSREVRADDFILIPGACVSCYARGDLNLLRVDWAISVSCGLEEGEPTATDVTLLSVQVDGLEVSQPSLPSGIHDPKYVATVDEPWYVDWSAAPPAVPLTREHWPVNDRVYTGTYYIDNQAQGLHTATIGIYSNAKLCRIRTRKMSIRWWPRSGV